MEYMKDGDLLNYLKSKQQIKEVFIQQYSLQSILNVIKLFFKKRYSF